MWAKRWISGHPKILPFGQLIAVIEYLATTVLITTPQETDQHNTGSVVASFKYLVLSTRSILISLVAINSLNYNSLNSLTDLTVVRASKSCGADGEPSVDGWLLMTTKSKQSSCH